MQSITTQQLIEKRNEQSDISIIDVREDDEVAQGMIPGARHIPMGDIPQHLEDIDKNTTHYIVCRSGGRSAKVRDFMNEKGYNILNVDGGMLDWDQDTVSK